jgi:periplasmic divalent cation tolerance protein
MSGPGAIASVYALFGDSDEAGRIGRLMVEEGLAACVNILGPCRSVYRWKGAIEEAVEVPAIFKTAQSLAPTLIDRIGELHGYDLPAAAIWPIEAALPAYADWVLSETIERQQSRR